MNRYLPMALMVVLCGACEDQALFNDIFPDLRQPSPDPDVGSGTGTPVPKSLWSEDFRTLVNKPGKIKTISTYWSFIPSGSSTVDGWSLFSNGRSHPEDNSIILDLRSQCNKADPTDEPVTAYAIFHPVSSYLVEKPTLCIEYYLADNNPVKLKISLLGSDLEKTISSKEKTFSMSYNMPLPKELISFDNEMPRQPIRGLQLECISSGQANHLRINKLTLFSGQSDCSP